MLVPLRAYRRRRRLEEERCQEQHTPCLQEGDGLDAEDDRHQPVPQEEHRDGDHEAHHHADQQPCSNQPHVGADSGARTAATVSVAHSSILSVGVAGATPTANHGTIVCASIAE